MKDSIFIDFSLDQFQICEDLEATILKQKDFNKIIINNTCTAVKGVELISKEWFKLKFKSYQNLLGLNFKLNEAVNNDFKDIPQFFDLNFKESFFIAFQSTIGDHGSKIFWKIPGRKKFYSLYIDNDETEDITNFFHEFLVYEMKNGRNGILPQFENKNVIRLQDIGDNNEKNLLLIASFWNRPNVVEKLLEHDFDVDYMDTDDFTAIDYSWENFKDSNNVSAKIEANRSLMLLLESNSAYPCEFKYDDASTEVKDFVVMCESSHFYVIENRFKLLSKKLEKFPKLIHFYNRNNKSLLAYALENKKYKILNFLHKGITFGSRENFSNAYNKIRSDKRAIQLRLKHQKNSKKPLEDHLMILKLKSRIGNNDQFANARWKYVEDAFYNLNENEYCKKILKVAATSKNLKIFFDFKHKSTFYLDPLTQSNSKGIIYSSGPILIGAEHLTDDEKKFEVYGVLAHELCHLAVNIAFMNNNFDPFPLGESQLKTRYVIEVMNQCIKLKEREKLVENVFTSYPEEYQDSELIVTIPQMLITYQRNREKIAELEGTFVQLFRYSREVVDEELQNALNVLNLLDDEGFSIKFEDLTEPMKAKLRHSKILFQGEETSFYEICGSDKEVLEKLTSKNIRDMILDREKLKLCEKFEVSAKYKIIERSFIAIGRNNVKRFDQILKEVYGLKVMILADIAGAGKTTTFQDFAMRLKQIYKSFWVAFITLRKHRELFEQFQKNYRGLSVEKLCQLFIEVLCLKTDLEIKTFRKLFFAGKVLFLFDGIDEISPKFNEFIIKILEFIKSSTENQQWISTRTQHANALELSLKTVVHKFAEYNDHERFNFIKEILIFYKVDDFEEKCKEIQKFINNIESRRLYKQCDIGNPLMIKIITELCIDKTIDLKSDCLNFYKLFQIMINKQKEEIDQKVPTEDRDPFIKFNHGEIHQVYAIKVIFGNDDEKNIESLGIIKQWNREKLKWTVDRIQRYGFFTVDLSRSLDDDISIDFIHRTYAEFFVVEFIVSYLFSTNYTIRDEEFEKVFKLLISIVNEIYDYNFLYDLLFNYLKVCNEKLHDNIKELIIRNIPNIHEKLFEFYQLDTLEFWILLLKNEKEILKMLWETDKKDNLLIRIISNYSFKTDDWENLFDLVEFCFGLNWHQAFDENNIQFMSDEEIERISEINKFDQNLLKLLNLTYARYENSEFHVPVSSREQFQNNLNFISQQSNSNSNEDGQKFIGIINRFVDLKSEEMLRIMVEKMETMLHNDIDTIKKCLFNSEATNLLGNVINTKNAELFRKFRTFFTKYKNSWKELQNILENCCDEILLIENINEEIYGEFKNFIKEIYETNGAEVISSLIRNYRIKNGSKTLEILEDFVDHIDKSNAHIFMKDILNNNNNSQVLIEILNSNEVQKFIYGKDLFLKYKNSTEDLKQVVINNCYLPELFTSANPNILNEFVNFLGEIFTSNKDELLKCMMTDEIRSDFIIPKKPIYKVFYVDMYDNNSQQKMREIRKAILIKNWKWRGFSESNELQTSFNEKYCYKIMLMSNLDNLKIFVNFIFGLFDDDKASAWKFLKNGLFEKFKNWNFFTFCSIIGHSFGDNYWILIEVICDENKLELFEKLTLIFYEGNEAITKEFFAKILINFNDHNFHPFLRAAKLKDFKFFKGIKTFASKYKNSWKELQEYFVFNKDLLNILSEINHETFQELKAFLNDIFEFNPEEILKCFDKNSWINFDLDSNLKVINYLEDISKSFQNNKLEVEIMRKLLLHKYWVQSHPIINLMMSKEFENFQKLKFIFSKYKVTIQELQKMSTLYLSLPNSVLYMNAQIYKEFKKFIKEIFKESKSKLLDCLNCTKFHMNSNMTIKYENFDIFEDFVNFITNDNTSQSKEIIRRILFQNCNGKNLLYDAIESNSSNNFIIMKNLYIKYKLSWIELQDFLINIHDFKNMDEVLHLELEKFKKLVFESNH